MPRIMVLELNGYMSDIEPHENVTWVEYYTALDLRKVQLEDETTAQIIRRIEDDHKPSYAYLALASPVIKYFWLLRRQLVVLSGVVYYQRAEQQTGYYGNRGEGVLVAPEPLQKSILEHCLDKPGDGHMRMNKTTERYAIWYKMLYSFSNTAARSKPVSRCTLLHFNLKAVIESRPRIFGPCPFTISTGSVVAWSWYFMLIFTVPSRGSFSPVYVLSKSALETSDFCLGQI